MTNRHPYQILKNLSLIHILLTLGSVLIVGVIYTLKVRANEVISSEKGMDIFEFLVPILAFASLAGAHYYGKSRIKKMDKGTLVDKLNVYRVNKIILWAALEGSIYLAIMAFYLTGRNNLMLYAFMLVILLVYFRPLKTRVIEDLNLSGEESDQLDKEYE
ncbi:MAG: hypothetical protein COA58_02360 [Bacteroidetes bacterium]|nr:MAG: hypothetical protein COA58_02360 [Bacteroidota bacterium]